jgi:hypothetical protein
VNQPDSETVSGAGRHRATAEPGPVPVAHPVLRVISGNPSPEEIAAVTVVLTAIAGDGGEAPAPAKLRIGSWADPAARLRQPLRVGTGGWRATGRS